MAEDTCKCPSECVRHGKCDECKAHHEKKGNLPHCQRPVQ